MKKISLKNIALLCGVSPSAVSFVLNGKAKEMRISEALARRIIEVAETHGYQPNQVAVSLRTGKSKILALVIESIGGNFFGALAKVIEVEAGKLGYRIIYGSTENNPVKGRDLLQMFSNTHVDGYLITPVKGMEDAVDGLVKRKVPLVMIDGFFEKTAAPYVLTNNSAAVTEGMNYLISKGYRNIAFVTVESGLTQIYRREEAYLQSLRIHKLKQSSLILRLRYNYDKKSGEKEISEFLRSHPGTDAVFFATNYLGITGLKSITALKLRVPDDIAVICFDDHDVFSLFPPGICSIRQSVEEIGRSAVQLLARQLNNEKLTAAQRHVLVKAKLVRRGSI